MDPATLLTLTQTIIQVLDSSFVKEVASLGSFRTQVTKLKSTTSTIKAVLVDAEEQGRQMVPMSNMELDWLQKLKNAVYQADDLFDYIVYIYQRNKSVMSGNTVLLNEVRLFFSRSNQLSFALNTCRKVKHIRERLDDIAKDHRDFCSKPLLSGGERLVTQKREDSQSFVYDEDVIGRDADKRAVLDMLLDSSVEEVHFVTIVGIGGLGKTALAQLIYNDSHFVAEFDIRMWVCVSDEFDMRDILCKLLRSAVNQHVPVDELHQRVRRKIKGKKYFLVLDDVWNEDRHKWLQLRDLLIGGGKGSRVLLTSRSKLVATIVGDASPYELKGLSPEHSWQLFQKMAFRDEEERTDDDLINIGKYILNKCANVPLAIRVVGSLLYGQTKSTWISFTSRDLIKMKKDDKDGILPILKLSYHHLTLPLKSCFSFCAIFPKDYRIVKEVLVRLWMAHGFLIPSEGQTIRDVAEEYFMILLQRCFFQDAERDDYGNIVVCKLHDLMHDVAQDVVGRHILIVDSISELKENPLHLSFGKMGILSGSSSFSEMENVRTFFKLWNDYSGIRTREIKSFFEKPKKLRVLCFSKTNIRTLPSAIDKLVHLRYLDVSHNYEMEILPATLSRLLNLQTLILTECCNLKELPQDLSKLQKLRYLDINGCGRMAYMPPGISKLTCLETLPFFIVDYSQIGRAQRGRLQDLESLTNLGGSLKISVHGFLTNVNPEGAKYVSGMKHLKDLHVEISGLNSNTESMLLLEGLQPNCNLRSFNLSGYNGEAFATWESMADLRASLPNLVNFSLYHCGNLQHLPLLSRLCHLKTLHLNNLDNLEGIEYCLGSSLSAHDQSPLFPCLEDLHLEALPKLKQWRRSSLESMVRDSNFRCDLVPYSFPRLFVLNITGCPYMTSIPLISNLKTLIITFDRNGPCSSSFLNSCCLTSSTELTMKVNNNENLESLSVFEDLFQSRLSTSLLSLEICGWRYLKNLCGGGLEQLTALRTLRLLELDELNKLDDVSEILQLSRLCHLRTLHLSSLGNLEGLEHCVGSSMSAHDQSTLFPCLENLHLEALPKLKQWRRSSSESLVMGSNFRSDVVLYSFPRLVDLNITDCPYITFIPLTSNIKTLIITCDRNAPSSSSFLSSCCLTSSTVLTIKICNNENLESLSVFEDLFRSHLSTSLQSLEICGWRYLKSLCGGGLEQLTALQTLRLLELELNKLYDVNGNLQHLPLLRLLCHLKTLHLSNLDNLEGIEHCVGSSISEHDQSTLFSYLENLHLESLPKLKQWRRSSSESLVMGSNFRCDVVPYSFPRLVDLNITDCPYMTSIPLPLKLRTLIIACDRNPLCFQKEKEEMPPAPPSFLSSCCLTRSTKLTIKVYDNENLRNSSVFEDLIRSCLSTSLEVSVPVELRMVLPKELGRRVR